MRKLHLVGLTTDRDGLIFTARKGSKSGGFIVPLDDAVLTAVADARRAVEGAAVGTSAEEAEVDTAPRRSRQESSLTPREMQARLRAGRSIDEVAAEAGVDGDWVARFAVPILAEQAQVVELARGLVYAKPRLGESSEPLNTSVVQNLSDRGLFLPDDVADSGWSAFQLHDSVWMVRFRYRSRGRDQEAQWEVDVPAGRLQARNRLASDLGYVEAGRRQRLLAVEEATEEGSEPAPVRRPAKRAPATTRAPAKRPGAATRATAKAGRARRAGPTAKRSTTAKASGARSVAPSSRAAKSTAAKSTAAKSSAVKATATKAAAAKSVAVKSSAAGPRPVAGRAAAPVATRAVSRRAAPVAKVGTPGGPAREPAGRRSSKAAPSPDPGPSARTGGVRAAVAQISAARVSASMATAERAPWAGVVAPRPGPWAATIGEDRPGSRRVMSLAERPRPRAVPSVPEFEPRPLPSGRESAAASRPPRPAARTRASTGDADDAGEPRQVSLPAPRQPLPRQEPIPLDRPKRRRLRSR